MQECELKKADQTVCDLNSLDYPRMGIAKSTVNSGLLFCAAVKSSDLKALSTEFDSEPEINLEPAVVTAKPASKEVSGAKVHQSVEEVQEVCEVERGIKTSQSVCRRARALLRFGLFRILFVYLVGHAVSKTSTLVTLSHLGSPSLQRMFAGVVASRPG